MPRRLTATINRIRCHTTDAVPAPAGSTTPTILAIVDLLDRLEQLALIDDNAPSAIDGYPTKTPGARPPEATGIRLDAHGNVIIPDLDDIGPDTTVEAAALTLIERGDPRDVIHRIRLEAEHQAELAALALTRLAGALARADNLRLPLPADTPQCWVASVVHRLPSDTKWIPGDTGKKTRFLNVIQHPWREDRLVCRWVYDFTRRWRRLPTRDEMLEYLETGKVKINETVEARTGRCA